MLIHTNGVKKVSHVLVYGFMGDTCLHVLFTWESSEALCVEEATCLVLYLSPVCEVYKHTYILAHPLCDLC